MAKSLLEVSTRVKSLIFSPHLDDAVFSLGGLLSREKRLDCTVVSVFTRSRYRIDGLGLESEVTNARLREDERALGSLGVQRVVLGLPDSSLKECYSSESEYMDPEVSVSSDPSWASVKGAVEQVVSSSPGSLLLFPLGVGGHVEHRLLAEIGGMLEVSHAAAFYEDVGYEDALSDEAIEARLRAVGVAKSSLVVPIDIEMKLRVARMYETQWNFDMEGLVVRTATRIGGERIWGAERVLSVLSTLFV